MIDLGHRLVRLSAMGLNLDENYFDDAMFKPDANLRLLHYPASKKASNIVGCGPQTAPSHVITTSIMKVKTHRPIR